MNLNTLFLILFFLLQLAFSPASSSFDYPTAGLGTRWINSPLNRSIDFFDGSRARALLLRGSLGPRFACGFYCSSSSCAANKYLFGVFIVITNSGSGIVMPALGFPQLVWSPNRHRPVSDNATLELQKFGNLQLRDAGGELVWESRTGGSGVDRLSLDESGNLILQSSSSGKIFWQSFDHPSDVILPGQILRPGTKVFSGSSASDATPGRFFLAMEEQGLVLYVNSTPEPQPYWKRVVEPATAGGSAFARYGNQSLEIFVSSPAAQFPDAAIKLARVQSAQYLKLAHDGRLLLHVWDEDRGWKVELDVIQAGVRSPSKCNLPTACGRFGVCTDDGECSCPRSFLPVDSLRPSKGCVPPNPYKCSSSSKGAGFVEIAGIDYFANDFGSGIWGKSRQQCRDLCRGDCSCRAAFYRNGARVAKPSEGGLCYLVSEVFTLRNSYRGPGYTSIAYIRV